jgi:hypothetical protein
VCVCVCVRARARACFVWLRRNISFLFHLFSFKSKISLILLLIDLVQMKQIVLLPQYQQTNSFITAVSTNKFVSNWISMSALIHPYIHPRTHTQNFTAHLVKCNIGIMELWTLSPTYYTSWSKLCTENSNDSCENKYILKFMENNKRVERPKPMCSIRFPVGEIFFFLCQSLNFGVEAQLVSYLIGKGK